ncbi:hypothetical protein [Pseudomonas psychrophila]|uniref:hypothetical protein n=1 Tax=Pseudomonas psychrophila TaxID=122355 RepID=UPI000363B766|nr:hypothetical protein [Pseudomonas psychrophila]
MNKIDADIKIFVELIEQAIYIAKRIRFESICSPGNERVASPTEKTIDILTRFQESALNNEILRTSKKDVPSGTGLGLSRGVGEWSSGEALLESIYKIENFYRNVL